LTKNPHLRLILELVAEGRGASIARRIDIDYYRRGGESIAPVSVRRELFRLASLGLVSPRIEATFSDGEEVTREWWAITGAGKRELATGGINPANE
jgi:hypothetical protein